jgi:integrase
MTRCLESTSGDSREVKVWLTDDDIDDIDDIDDLCRAAASQRDDIIIQLGAYVGRRAFEVPQVQPQHVDTTDGGTYRLRVPQGKDTTGGGGKPRDAYLPPPVERDLQRYQNFENIPPREPFVDLSGRGVRAAVKRTAEAASNRSVSS